MNGGFTKKRTKDETDLVSLFILHVSHIVGKSESEVINNSVEIRGVADFNPLMQKITINSKLRSILLLYANKTGGDITGLLSYILDDAEDYVWLDMLDRTILRFFKEKDVLNKI